MAFRSVLSSRRSAAACIHLDALGVRWTVGCRHCGSCRNSSLSRTWLVLTFDADDAPYHHAPIWQRCPPLLWTLSRWKCFWCLRKTLRSKLGCRRWWRGMLFVRPPFVVPKCNELVGDSRGLGSTRVICSEKVWSVCSHGR